MNVLTALEKYMLTNELNLPALFYFTFRRVNVNFQKKYQFTRYRSLESFIKFICLGLREEGRMVLHCGILSICVTQGYWPTYLCLGAGEEGGGFLHCGVWTVCLLWGHLLHPPCSSVIKTEQQSLYITNQTMSLAFIALNCEYKINKTSFRYM